jgi:cell division protein FtsI (penicillin-binding protein 3)
MSIKKDILWRVGLVYLGVALFALLVLVKIVYLQFIDDDRWKEQSEATRVKNVKIQPHRGDIYSDDMRLLASSVPYYEIRMDLLTPYITNSVFANKVDSLALCLSRLFKDRSKSEYKECLVNARKQGNRYYMIKDDVDFSQLKKLRTFPIFNRGRYTGGLIVVDESLRQRPHRDLAARTIGYISKSEGGNVVGIEGAYNSYLGGVEGIMRMQKLSGNIWMPLDESGEIEPQDGSSVVTTINIDIQEVAEKALKRQLSLNRAHHGCAVLMEVKTGEIKAIVNLTDTLGTYVEDYNYAVGESTEPGSTFKLASLVTALEDGYVDLNDTINTGNGVFQYYDFTIHDDNFDKGGCGTITVKQVFEYSSNVGMAMIITKAYKKSPHSFVDRLYSMSLNKPLGLDIKGEGAPYIKYPGAKTWSGVTLATMSYGYEVRLTPLQILCFYNAVANDGKMVRPRFAKEIRNHGKIEKTFVTEVINPSICSKSTLKKARELLEGVVTEGTAKNLKNNYLKIAGKTGTTQIYNNRYGYKMDSKVSYQASFVGYFPADQPKYSCIVVINSPSSDVYHGNRVAGPVFLEIADKVFATSLEMQKPINSSDWFFSDKNVELPYSKSGSMDDLKTALKKLDVKEKVDDRNAEWVTPERKDDFVELKTKKITNNLVPNVVSMGLKDAIYLLENMGLRVKAVGRGSVRNQSITPGTRIKKGDIIRLELTYTEG